VPPSQLVVHSASRADNKWNGYRWIGDKSSKAVGGALGVRAETGKNTARVLCAAQQRGGWIRGTYETDH
jgi:hypothetical protein